MEQEYVFCEKDGVTGPNNTEYGMFQREAERLWNTRVIEDALIAALKNALSFLEAVADQYEKNGWDSSSLRQNKIAQGKAALLLAEKGIEESG